MSDRSTRRSRTARPTTSTESAAALSQLDEALDEIQRRVLWLAVNIVHHANNLRPNPSKIKVGGHQASTASTVTILTELFFEFMRPGDRISVKPHASPALHAIHYLLGNLERRYLPTLRAFHGLQAYPSRTKDPDPVDFSTGSVGLGSVAPNFAALVDRLVHSRYGALPRPRRRFISLVGDAELDEGSVWEAVAEPALSGLDNLIWIVDLNRQSLDRVVPGIRVKQLEAMFRANGWTVVEAKYGRRLREVMNQTPGLHEAIEEMPNELYQYLLRSSAAEISSTLGAATPRVDPDELRSLIADLGGHDFETLREALRLADEASGPAVVFAYTIKGWGLPIAGDPLNHSAMLSADEIDKLRVKLQVPVEDEWAALALGSRGGELVERRRQILVPSAPVPKIDVAVPEDLHRGYAGVLSTQRALGQILTELTRSAPAVSSRLVTVSPDVATSTNLGGWINKVGIWEATETRDPFTALGPRLIEWQRSPLGQHVELGLSETNLLMMLGQLGLAAEMTGEPLLPVGTLYDPFVARALDAYIYGVYSGSRFILIGTPSGVTLAPEGGAHQSVVTPSLGVALPLVAYWEPCFAQELEWIFLSALGRLHGSNPESAYLRLSTAPVDQSLMPIWADRAAQRAAVLSGAWMVLDASQQPGADDQNQVHIWATGVMVLEAIKAANDMQLDGVHASVFSCVSPDLVFRSWQDWAGRGGPPVVTVLDGHPSALAWVGTMLGVRGEALGVTGYGQSGTPAELYREFGLDAEAISLAGFRVLGD